MKEPQLSGIASALAKQGRHGDDTLIHVSRKELEALKKMGDGLGIHLTKNPQTGLPEAFNWLGMLGGVAGGIIGTIIAPGAGTAAGAALGSGLGTAAGGGSTKQALMAGVIGGITGYAGAGIAGGLASAGEQAIAQGVTDTATQGIVQGTTDAATQGVVQGTTDAATQGVVQGTTDVAAQGVTQGTTGTATQATTGEVAGRGVGDLIQSADKYANLAQPDYTSIVQKGLDAGKSVTNINADLAVNNATYGDKLAAGWDKVTASPSALGNFASANMKNIAMTGIGTLGVGALNPTESTINTNTSSSNTGGNYKGEMYQDPATGQWRSRAVRVAAEGGPMFADYDAADAEADGGYSPGGVASLNTGGSASAVTADGKSSAFDYSPSDPALSEGILALPKDYTPEQYAIYDWLSGAKKGDIPTGGRRRRLDDYAEGGGIGNLGSFSDGGRLLKGPGDGISDNIPATIENKRPARLADGEFVIPARAVSELGNGSTEAGSKQLYKMLDRISAKRKKGKGLAYEANPQKLMPA